MSYIDTKKVIFIITVLFVDSTIIMSRYKNIFKNYKRIQTTRYFNSKLFQKPSKLFVHVTKRGVTTGDLTNYEVSQKH